MVCKTSGTDECTCQAYKGCNILNVYYDKKEVIMESVNNNLVAGELIEFFHPDDYYFTSNGVAKVLVDFDYDSIKAEFSRSHIELPRIDFKEWLISSGYVVDFPIKEVYL